MEYQYGEFLNRIVEERNRLGFSQESLAVKLGKAQGTYSKNETGEKRFSFQDLQILNMLHFDLYYAYTGYHKTIKLESEKDVDSRFYLQSIFIALSQDSNKIESLLKEKLEYIQYIAYFSSIREESVYKILSMYQDMTQEKLANLVGVDPKTLRSMQRGQKMPNSEILYVTFQNFGVVPQIFLECENAMLYQADYVLKILDEEQKKRVSTYLKKFSA